MLENVVPQSYMSSGACTTLTPADDILMSPSFSWIIYQINCTLYSKLISVSGSTFLYKHALYILAVRTVNVTCPRSLSSSVCPPSPSSDPANADQTPLSNGTADWQRYRSAKDNGFPSTVCLF